MSIVPVPKRDEIRPLELLDPHKADAVELANTALSDFRATDNRLYLDLVVGICVEREIPIPGPCQLFANRQIGRIGALLLEKGTRKDIPDVILGTCNSQGGRNAFRDYLDRESGKALVCDIYEYADAIMRDKISVDDVFEKLATKLKLTPERLRKKFRQHGGLDQWMSLKQGQAAYRALGTRDTKGQVRLVVDIDDPLADVEGAEDVPGSGFFGPWRLPRENI